MGKERLRQPEEFFRIYPPSSDNDAVLVDTRTVVVEEFNNRYGTNHKPEEMCQWHMIAKWAKELGMSEEEALAIDNELWYSAEILFRAKPKPGASDFTFWFANRGIYLPIITSRPYYLKESTIEWYQEWMPWVKADQIIMRENDEMDGHIFKVWMIQLLKRGIHFEDATVHAKAILDYTDAKVVFLSNSIVLDHYSKDRLIRIPGVGGQFPDMYPVNEMFLTGRISNVAQC